MLNLRAGGHHAKGYTFILYPSHCSQMLPGTLEQKSGFLLQGLDTIIQINDSPAEVRIESFGLHLPKSPSSQLAVVLG